MTINDKQKPGYKHTYMGWIPNEWEVLPLIGICKDGISNGVFNDPQKTGRGYRLVNVTDLYNDIKINTSKLSKLELSREEFLKNKLSKGDTLFTRSSLKLEGIAHCNIILDDSDDITYDGHIMKISPNASLIDPVFLCEYSAHKEFPGFC